MKFQKLIFQKQLLEIKEQNKLTSHFFFRVAFKALLSSHLSQHLYNKYNPVCFTSWPCYQKSIGRYSLCYHQKKILHSSQLSHFKGVQ